MIARTLIFLCFFLSVAASAQQDYDNLKSKIVFENDEVVIQHFIMMPGAFSGPHTHPGKQMEILLSDGVGMLYEASGKEIRLDMKAGDVRWIDPLLEPHNFKNTGETPIEWYLINLK